MVNRWFAMIARILVLVMVSPFIFSWFLDSAGLVKTVQGATGTTSNLLYNSGFEYGSVTVPAGTVLPTTTTAVTYGNRPQWELFDSCGS